jgi:ubiquinone/menaquinone biosynthesis C-methylase UbiE
MSAEPQRHLRLYVLAAVALCALLPYPVPAQATHPVTGRPIAPVMGMGGAPWLERSEREKEESPTRAVELLDLRKGMNVADVGAGIGYYVQKIAPKIAPGIVYANDIQPGMLDALNVRMDKAGIHNYRAILGSETDPRLPENHMDLILLVDVYHELSKPQEMLAHMRRALKPEGRLVLLEYRKEDPDIPIRPEHKMSVQEVKAELEPEGFTLVKVISDKLPWQHILFFSKRSM